MNPLNRTSCSIDNRHSQRILQFGGGNFLRAFFNWMVEEMNEVCDFDASVLLVKPTRRGNYQGLKDQDGLFHLIQEGLTNGQATSRTKLITNIEEIIDPYSNWQAYLNSAQEPDIRFVVSNTTEAGIAYDDSLTFDQRAPDNFPAKLTHWLYARFQYFKAAPEKGCLFLPCELIEKNGELLRDYILQYAKKWDLGSSFVNWIDRNNIFYNTLVDRIVPGYPGKEAPSIEKEIDFKDNFLVKAEKYHSWIIEGPKTELLEIPFHRAGLNVKWVPDLTPYRQLKVRLLNGAHTAMVPVGYLLGEQLVRSAIGNQLIREFLDKLLHREIKPTIALPNNEIDNFISDVLERFSNPYIDHQLMAISLNSISKFRTRLLPSLIDSLRSQGGKFQLMIFSFAALCHFYKGALAEPPIALNDSKTEIDFFQVLWTRHYQQNKSFYEFSVEVMNHSDIWGTALPEAKQIVVNLSTHLESIESNGMEKALKLLLDEY